MQLAQTTWAPGSPSSGAMCGPSGPVRRVASLTSTDGSAILRPEFSAREVGAGLPRQRHLREKAYEKLEWQSAGRPGCRLLGRAVPGARVGEHRDFVSIELSPHGNRPEQVRVTPHLSDRSYAVHGIHDLTRHSRQQRSRAQPYHSDEHAPRQGRADEFASGDGGAFILPELSTCGLVFS